MSSVDVPVVTAGTPVLASWGNQVRTDLLELQSKTSTWIDVKEYGAVGDGVTDDTAAIQAATAAVATAGGGTVRIPVGTYRINSTILLPNNRVALVGDDEAGTVLEYHGTATAIDITADARVRVENMRIVNSDGTGTYGIVVGCSQPYTGWKYEIRRVELEGFATAGLHVANCEQSIFEYVYAHNGAGVGFLVNNARHTGAVSGGWNQFLLCRAAANTGEGWDVNLQIFARFVACQSFNNAPGVATAYQFRLRGSTFQCSLIDLDLEDHTTSGTSGVVMAGTYNSIDNVLGYKLNKLVELAATTGVVVGRMRPSTVTTPLIVGGTCVDTTILDGGNLGTITDAAPEVTNFFGRRSRTRWAEITGTAGAGYIEFRNEQTADPAAPAANRARLFTKDNGSGKTQLCVRFGTGATQVIATEP